ncbi:MAG: glycosyltransferase [Janthinobacterium lividum]
MMPTSTRLHGSWHIAVLIPARNEEQLLPRCLSSVLQALELLPAEVTTDVIVVADSCADATAQCAEVMLYGKGLVLSVNAGNVGVARGLAAQQALVRFRGDGSRCWLANTDADCQVPATWLLDQLHLANQGYGAVAGIIDVDCFAEHLPFVESRFRSSYILHADGTHPHVHGANLGVRADAYLHAGAWNPLSTAEDHDLWKRLRNGTLPCLSDARLQVLTSGRRVGRAPLGFAGALAKHNEVPAEGAAA